MANFTLPGKCHKGPNSEDASPPESQKSDPGATPRPEVSATVATTVAAPIAKLQRWQQLQVQIAVLNCHLALPINHKHSADACCTIMT